MIVQVCQQNVMFCVMCNPLNYFSNISCFTTKSLHFLALFSISSISPCNIRRAAARVCQPGDPQPLPHSLLLQVFLQQLIAFPLSDEHWIYIQDI